MRELGIRKSLGAQRGDLYRLVLSGAGRVVAAGLTMGLAAALGVASLLTDLVHGISPRDPVSLIGATLLILTVALLSAALPARRAARVDPMTALRID